MSDGEEELFASVFEEPEDFRPPPPQNHFTKFKRFTTDLITGKELSHPIESVEPQSIELRLIGSSPLWGHLLWNAGRFTAEFLDENFKDLVENKSILELGAAGGLPSLVCSLNNPKKVICTDYPDVELIDNINYNFNKLFEKKPELHEKVSVKGYIWGNEYSFCEPSEKFDLIILSDLCFNHTEHYKLLKTCQDLISPQGRCLVVFSPHRPWLLNDDLDFFTKAKEFNFKVEKIDLVNWKPMFEEDPDTEEIRGRVYSFWMIPNVI